MKKIILSKQCDIDADLFELWAHWYTSAFPVDLVVLTPVVIPGGPPIKKTLSFYLDALPNRLICCPICRDDWNAAEIWKAQIEILKHYVDTSDFWLSADADQFFDLSDLADNGSGLRLFKRINMISRDQATLENISHADIRARLWRSYSAGQFGRVDHPRVGATGHALDASCKRFKPYQDDIDAGTEWHFMTRGFSQFYKKISALPGVDTAGGSSHWAKWKAILADQGEDGLREEFERAFSSRVYRSDKLFPAEVPISSVGFVEHFSGEGDEFDDTESTQRGMDSFGT